MKFRILRKSQKSQARLAELKFSNGTIKAPFFMPIATYGAVKNISASELEKIGAQILLSNTYHLNERPGSGLIKKIGGLHRFLSWQKPILTDSGGFQLFSLGQKNRQVTSDVKCSVKIKKDGVEFSSPIDGSKHFFTPEKVLDIQTELGVDIAMVLDVCAEYPIAYKKAEQAVEQTFQWAKKAVAWKKKNKKSPQVFGIIQGSVYQDLRLKSLEQIAGLDFDGLAIGGVSVGETKKEMYEAFGLIGPKLPENKPRYAMGIGYPEDIVEAVRQGFDMFDCVIPTREGRHGKLFMGLQKSLADDFYKTINITRAEFKTDVKPVDKDCDCELCQNYTRAYLHHLFRIKEGLALRLSALHNLRFYVKLMVAIRKAVQQGRL